MNIESHTVSVENASIHFLKSGKGSRTIVFLHGISFNAAVWRKTGILSDVAAAGYCVYAVDLPGFGNSSPWDAPLNTVLKPIMDALGVSAAVLVAPSFSGRCAFPFIIAHPERVRGFVAVGARGIHAHQAGLKTLAFPILAVWGENDDVVPVANADLLMRETPKGRKVIIPGGTHAPYLSDPRRFTKELLRFCRTCFTSGSAS